MTKMNETIQPENKETDTTVSNEEVLEEIIEEVVAENQEIVDEALDLNAKIIELEAEIVKLKNEYAKAYADTENTRRRLQNEADMNKKYRIQTFAADILPAIDNLERALSSSTENDNESFRKGVEMIYNQIIYALSKEGVEAIDALDQPFDHNFHQALMTEVKEGVEPNMVIEVLQKGYKIKDRILRPAMVKVSE
ncbi:MAG: nucleotide exchange factor GrpE [Erysipelotrichaceae bacterium]